MSKPTDYNYWLGVVGFGNTEAAIALHAEFNRLEAKLAATEAVCEAAQAVVSETDVRDELLCYVMGIELMERLETWRKLREGT